MGFDNGVVDAAENPRETVRFRAREKSRGGENVFIGIIAFYQLG